MLVMMAALGRVAGAATAAQVADAIDRGKAYLYSHQLHGNWEALGKSQYDPKVPNDPSGLQFGGMTAIATFALLACGENPQSNDHLKEAVNWLEKADLRGTYAISLRSQIWNLLPEDETVKKMRRHDRDALLEGIRNKGEAAGFFGYGEGMDKRQYDHSVSQFGVLGLWSAAQGGEEIESRYWRLLDKSWRGQQQADGAWCYLADPLQGEEAAQAPPGLGGELLSMTAAGVATLFITQDYASPGAKCEGNVKDANIASGMRWIGSHLDTIDSNPWAQQWRYYIMFGICRIGLASGYKYIGTTDWFQWGADTLLKEQDPNGSWGAGEEKVAPSTPDFDAGVFNTSFSLLFFSRGRAPVLFNKLQYNILKSPKKIEEGNWNQRPRDIANLTRFLGRQSETDLNWQIVNLQEQAADLIDAPMLYMSGNQVLSLTPGDLQKLREYVNEGGIIVGHADCGAIAFSQSFRKLGEEMFPGRTFHEMPADHPIFSNENFQARSWKLVPHVEVLDNGARVQMLLLPSGDPARVWQSQSFLPVKQDVFSQLMMDIYLYAVDTQGLRTKGDTFIVKRRASVQAKNAETPIKIARLQYAGNWDPEPGGWQRLSNIFHNHLKTDITAVPVELGKGLLTNEYKFADLTGTDAIKLTDAQRDELKKFVDGGGTLLVDAAGGKTAFSVPMLDAMTKAFGSSPKVLPISSAVFTAGDPISDVQYRKFAREKLGSLRAPQLRGIETGKRIGVFFSNEDLAVGLVGQPVDGIIGYDPVSATHIVENIVLYALR
jgi:hypothetical protein